MPGEGRARSLIIASRALSEAAIVAAGAASLNALTYGRSPVPLVASTLAFFGATLVAATVLRERGTVRRSGLLTVATIGAMVAWSLALPARTPDVLAGMTRVLVFALLGEAYLWRLVDLARGAQRWRDIRDATLLAMLVIVVAALVAGSVDREALPALGLAVAIAGAAALSLARSVEELSLGKRDIEGRATTSAATGSAFVLGSLAIVAAALLPSAQALLGDLARAAGPLLSNLLYSILLPLGYVAAWFVYAALWLRDTLHLGQVPLIPPPRNPYADDDELLRRLREMDQQRPYVFGAFEVVIALIGVVVALVIVARLVSERRLAHGDGVDVERESVEGIGLRATAGLLFPRRPPRPRVAVDDGTPAGRLRRLYGRLLEVAEKRGPGRRVPAETPAEHERRLLAEGPRWGPASVIVRAFEDLRYGDTLPDGETVERARAALARVEAGG